MAATIVDCYVGAELNELRLEITAGDAVVGPAWMALITRIVLKFGGLTVDSSTATAGTFDWTTEAADSVVRMFLGKAVVTANAPTEGKYDSRFDIYHGGDNAVIAHDKQKTLKVAVWADAL